MQAVILTAGRGSRMGALTKDTPKTLLPVAGKSLLEWKFDALPDEIDEIVLVVGYLGDMIRERFGDKYKNRKVVYVEQANPVGGTMNALQHARDIVSDKFLVMNGDNIYSSDDMKKMLQYDWAILALKKEDLGNAARMLVDEHGRVIEILESETHRGGAGFANAGMYTLDKRIFDYPPVPKSPGSTESGLPQTMLQAKDIPIHVVETVFLIDITVPDDLARAEALFGARK